MGSSSSESNTNVSNATTQTTSTIANAFNNALNTTQNFSNIGGYTPEGGKTFGAFNYTIVFAVVAALFGAVYLFKK